MHRHHVLDFSAHTAMEEEEDLFTRMDHEERDEMKE